MPKVIIDINEETGAIQVLDGGLDLVTLLGAIELAKHIVTHSDPEDGEEYPLDEDVEGNPLKTFSMGKGGKA